VAAVLGDEVAPAASRRALDEGLVINAPRSDVLRFAPSLLVSDADIDEAVATVGRVLDPLVAGAPAAGGTP
jgi:acetylornithine/N-succinyldiaminopimelate aminotransferase